MSKRILQKILIEKRGMLRVSFFIFFDAIFIASAVFFVAKVPVKKEDVSISNSVAFIRCSSVAKSAIQVARGAILNELFQEMPKARNTVRDIR